LVRPVTVADVDVEAVWENVDQVLPLLDEYWIV
jgi:hypothetical protein